MPQYQTGSSRADSVNNPVIAGELRRFRESLNGVTGDRVAADLKWSPSKVSRLERGRTATRRKALAQILSYYAQWHGMAPEKAEALMRMFDAAMEQSGLLNAWLGPSVLAATVTEWAPYAVPRLLQVPAYARAVLREMQQVTQMPPSEIEDTAAAIARWQARLKDKPPVALRALLDEGVLHRVVGSPAVMRDQLRYLEKISTTRGTDVQIRILPLSASGPRWTNGFAYLEYAPPADGTTPPPPPEVVTEDLEGPAQPDLTERLTWKRYTLWTQLWAVADEPGPAVKRALTETWT